MRKLLLRVFSLPIHPILVAAFPIIFLYAQNTNEVTWSQLVVPMAVSILATLALWLFFAIVLREKFKAALATSLLVFGFFSYGRLYDLLGSWNVALPHRHNLLVPLVILACGYAVYFLSMARWNARVATTVLNVVAAALVILNLATILVFSLQGAGVTSPVSKVQAVDTTGAADGLSTSEAKPDIYYIILDEYAHPDTMLQYYDYDNSGFTDDLADKGFFIAPDSTAANFFTWKAISSYLNMEYFPSGEPAEFYFQKIADSKVANSLRSMGYTYVYFGSWFDAGRYKVNADVYYNFYESAGSSAAVSDFSRTLWNTTMARPFYDHLTGSIYAGHYRSATVRTIECLKTVPKMEGPKFVFAHILCPHLPFVFGPNGEYVDPSDWFNTSDKQFYLGQYTFISNAIAGVVADILRDSSSDPIIILQSDHGLRPGVSGRDGIGGDEWLKVLNAYHLPGDGESDLYDSISPVNSFRVVFNHYFGGHYDLLQDSAV